MKELPSSEGKPPLLNKDGNPRLPIRYGLIWLLNALATTLAVAFFLITSTATREFLGDVQGLLFLAFVALSWAVPMVIGGTMVFLLTKRAVQKKGLPPAVSSWWLAAPAWFFAVGLLIYGVWGMTPQKRVAQVCGSYPSGARNIKVVGCTGMQMAQWLAVFELKEAEFVELTRKRGLQPDTAASFVDQLGGASLLRRTSLYAALPTVASTNWLCFKLEFRGVDGRIHGGVYAAYDSGSSRAIVLSEGY